VRWLDTALACGLFFFPGRRHKRETKESLQDEPPATHAAACRWRPRGTSRWLEVWHHRLTLGRPLPCLPLWLTDDLAISLDLEASYEKTCRDLRIV